MNLKKMMSESPYHRWLGVELVTIEPGKVVVTMKFREEFLGSDDRTNVHGGIIATLADITACFAMMSETNRDAPNVNLHVDYLRMAKPDKALTATGKVVKAGRMMGIADVEIHDEDGRLIAVGRSTTVNNAPPRETLTKG